MVARCTRQRFRLWICQRVGRSYSQLTSCEGDGQAVQRMSISTGPPRMGQPVAVGVELDAVGRRPDLAAAEQDLERLGGRHARAELATHDGGRTTTLP